MEQTWESVRPLPGTDLMEQPGWSESHVLPWSDLTAGIGTVGSGEDAVLYGHGVLEVMSDGWGFLRDASLLPGENDVYVSQSQVRRFGLRMGDWVGGVVRRPKETEKYISLLRVLTVNLQDPEEARNRPGFASLTTVYPQERFLLEAGGKMSGRIIDLIAPMGKGQRGLIVAPPKAGKTTLLKEIAWGITACCPETQLLVVLVDERPEEVTDIQRSVRGQVVSSTFDEHPDSHLRVCELALEESRRLVEGGRDVVILLDSLTRFARASNLTIHPSGRTLSGGLDPAAIQRPKRFFGAARNLEEGGSLTIIATVLVDTGSRMDELIYEEFKGTGNWELHLSRELQERRVFPAIDIRRSGTRHEELLVDEVTLSQMVKLHRALAALDTVQSAELLLDRLRTTATNAELLKMVEKSVRRSGD